MNSHNEIKRTLIAFSLALSLALVAFTIQDKKPIEEDEPTKLEAKVYPGKKEIMGK